MDKNESAKTQEEYIENNGQAPTSIKSFYANHATRVRKEDWYHTESMMTIETCKRPLQWSTYLALVLVFQ